MKMKLFFTSLILILTLLLYPQPGSAQMMTGSASSAGQGGGEIPSAQDLKDIQTGQDLFGKFQSKQLSCGQLKDDDFEKIGEYIMNQRFGGDSARHIQMNNTAKQMMGENGEEQMHIQLGKNTTGCNTNKQGGGNNMMGWGYSGMMSAGFGFLGTIIWVVVLIDLILLGVWLWKKIQK